MIKYISLLCLLLFSAFSFAVDRDSFNLVRPVVQAVPAHWIRTSESGEVSDTWYYCPTNNLEWRRVAPFYIETRPRPITVQPVSFRPQLPVFRSSGGSC
jgi:hypothetical protein